ncbi:MAG TPA: pantoate--beta-alanine ligase [Ignavibacteriaceae bacterium]|nr:pantoate--beta-alanine ligase [Ignavibacteriaceae bacterium]
MKSVSAIQSEISRLKRKGKTIGFVPTMGYLHEGHLSLVRKARSKADIIIASIFVNPTQFAPTEDLANYPRNINRDKARLVKEGVDILFFPDTKEIYTDEFQTFVQVNEITAKLEGESRPTHFRGVTTIVSILFNCVKPDFAFFGQKDVQQAEVIKRMVKDLKFNTKIVVSPIVREKDGLAMSSRNVYLSEQERKDALVLSQSLKKAKEKISGGERSTAKILSGMKRLINSVGSSDLDYVSIVEANSFRQEKKLIKGKKYYILIACKIGKTRLIDNLLIKA